jgi:hypothetical protein
MEAARRRLPKVKWILADTVPYFPEQWWNSVARDDYPAKDLKVSGFSC